MLNSFCYLRINIFSQLAVGFRDLGGTNRFASEYLVASKATKNFDFTLGIGWGKLVGITSNPLTNLNNRFNERGNSGETGTGGKFSPDAWFSEKGRQYLEVLSTFQNTCQD